LSQEKSEQRRLDVISGKIKPSKMSEMAKRAMEAQRQSTSQQLGKVNLVKPEELQETNFQTSNNVTDSVKVNGKGNKSRSQIKEEQRKRLAQSRSKENK
jgi:YidC/Oxa1 family membrane protein insertase